LVTVGDDHSPCDPVAGVEVELMDSHELRQLFRDVAEGRVDPAEAARRVVVHPYQDAGGFAKVDLHRRLRCGFPEVIFGQGKTAEQIEAILRTMLTHGQGGLVTRVDARAAEHLRAAFPEGEHNSVGRTFRVRGPGPEGPKLGRVFIVTAGTSDLPVAEEARITAEAWNCDVTLVADVGVAGLHRLLHQLPQFEHADAMVVVAGMEGALPSVVGGLVNCPVIAVPTSIGYGAHFQGLAALLGMLNSCASNVVVVNIDAGFNGGHMAGLIARRMGQARLEGSRGGSAPDAGLDRAELGVGRS
jgi:NCAIR mutase (PurE)-related protein